MIEKQPAPRLHIPDKPRRAGILGVPADWRIKMKRYVAIIGIGFLFGLSAYGKSEQNITSYPQNIQQSELNEKLEENGSIEQETADNSDNNTMQIYSEAHSLVDYDTVDELLGDACALVKVEVSQANSENVRNYIYTSYDMKVLDVLWGTDDADENIINVNMPGGTVQGDKAQEMLSEVTEGKNAGDLSGINQIVSDGNTDHLLSVGDKAYLFLMKESETSYAVVGEYRGEMLLENGNVFFDSCIIGFKDGVTTHGLENGSMVESSFIEAINELIYKDS